MGKTPLDRRANVAQAESVTGAQHPPKNSAPRELKRALSLADAVSMVVGIILGTGIFVAPAAVAALAPSLPVATALWGAGALVACCGALCYAECGARLPQDGGFFIFYERAFGWRWAYVAGWAALLISYPTSLAGVTALGTAYLDAAIPRLAAYPCAAAVAVLSATALLNAVGVSLGRWAQALLTWAKVAAIFAVLIAAVWWGHAPAPAELALSAEPAPGWTVGRLLIALSTLMWTYDGWTDITMVAGEVQRPERNLVRAVMFGLGILFIIYAATQAAIMVLLGARAAANSDQVLALALAQALGPYGRTTMAWLVLLTTLGSVHGLMFATSRLAYAMAQRGAIPSLFAHVNSRTNTPIRAIFCVWALSCLYVSGRTFAELLEIFALVIWLFYGATAVALWTLRKRGIGSKVHGLGLNTQLAPGVLAVAAIAMTALQMIDNLGRACLVLGLLGAGRLALCAIAQPPQKVGGEHHRPHI